MVSKNELRRAENVEKTAATKTTATERHTAPKPCGMCKCEKKRKKGKKKKTFEAV